MYKPLNKYPEGYDLTILNTIYQYPKKLENNKYDDGSITLIYKDNITKEKHFDLIKNPQYVFYMAKNDVPIDYNLLFIEKDKVNKYKVPYKELEKNLAELSNNEDFYKNNIKNGCRKQNKLLHTYNRFFLSDSNIEDHYRFRFDNKFTNNINPISKSFLDIEVDGINIKGDFPELGEAPINAVTVIFDHIGKVYTFLLRNPDNPLIEEFEKSINQNTFSELKELIRDTVGGWKNEVRYGLDKFEYELLFYDEELKLIQDLFILINNIKPDFLLAWNMAFDIPYTIERLKVLGVDPATIICHPNFTEKICKYFIDENHKEIEERGDYASISSYTVYLDQMIHYKSRRKGQARTSASLNYVGSVVAKVKKLEYSHITNNIVMLPYKDYKTFVFYNIIDTIVQKCIEVKTGDIDYLFSKATINNTRYHKSHRQTVYLTNRGIKEFYNNGLIMGNNINKFKEKDNTSYPGAFVASPLLINDIPKMKLNGVPVMLFNNLDDFDYKSLYPSIDRQFNMAANTQIGMITIPNQLREDENKYDFKYYTRGGAFLEDIHSGNIIETVYRWLNGANYNELIKDTIEYFSNVVNPLYPLYHSNKLMYIKNPNCKTRLCTFGNYKPKKIAYFKSPKINYNKIIKNTYNNINNINIDDFINLLDTIKLIKSDLVVTTNNLVIGTDIDFNILRTIEFNETFPITAFNWNEVNYAIKNNLSFNTYDAMIYSNIINKLDNVNQIKSTINPKIYNNVHENDDLINCLSKKAAEGASKFNIDNYLLYIWNGLLNKNKGDKIDIYIYDLSSDLYLVEFIIYKNKKITVHQYVKSFKL